MFLPISNEDLEKRNITEVDFVYVSGDAYVDHPSFGVAIISRVLDALGYKIVILAQPDWNDDSLFTQFGKPKLGFLVTSGNIDSIVNHYTVSKHRRKKDSYSDNGQIGKRPDYAVKVYCNKIRKLFPDVPIIIGGIEASLRRLCHYDYFQNKLLPSILIDSKADLISYGMGEKSIPEIAECLKSGLKIEDIIYIKGTVWKTSKKELLPTDSIYLPSFKDLKSEKKEFAKSFKIQSENLNPQNSFPLVEEYDSVYVVQNVASDVLSEEYLDWVYSLDYQRTFHPIYKNIPAISEVKFSITSNRGCLGSCSFCALNFHQGRIIQKRSKQSIVSEALKITALKDFKGYIHDIGGPSANFYKIPCTTQKEGSFCKHKKCMHPKICSNMNISHKEYLDVLREVRNIKGIKKVFIRSGVRYDYLLQDKDETFFEELVKNHVSGQLKVAPEHVSNKVLNYMQKPPIEVYEKFAEKYNQLNKRFGKEQYLVPYLMSSHPGCSLVEAVELALYLKKNNLRVEQVQDFYPTPGTLSTCMYYTGIDPRTGEAVYTATSPHEKAIQRALIQYHLPQNWNLIKEALVKIKRLDLIGDNKNCLIKANENKSFNKSYKKNFKKTFNK